MFIDPALINAYLWLPDDHEEYIDVICEFPKEFKQDQLLTELQNNDQEIYIGIQTMTPIVCGCLYDVATKIEKLPGEENTTIFRIHKKTKGNWDMVIKAPTEELSIIDPRSAFTLSQLFLNTQADPDLPDEKKAEIMNVALGYLKIAVACRYPDALVFAAQMTLNSNDVENPQEQAAILLNMAVAYGNPHAHFILGLILSQNPQTVGDSIPHFEAAVEGGIVDALNALGEIYSPEQLPKYDHEDADKAFGYFQKMLDISPDYSYALMNLAKLYAVGKGCEKDIKKAKEYRDKALSLNPELETFEIKEESEGSWHIAAAATAVAAAAGIAAMNIMKKK